MTMDLFHQFQSPSTLGIQLILVAIAMPTLLLTISHRLTPNRTAAVQIWLLTKFTKQIMTPISTNGLAWAALLLTMLSFLLFCNLLGLLPYTFTPTTQLSLNMAFAAPLWFTTVLIGLRNQPTHSLAHLLPIGTPTPLIPPLIIIETVSLLIRPLALGVRLTANLTAGHLLITLISTTALALAPISTTASSLTALLLLLLTILEIAVAMIQAYVFTLLLSLYLQENI
uniref:ATP synthase subunit a n=1 Tax=Cnemaspis limi TaxID=460617 RepID=K9JWW6_CNELI|nr:ATPase subunit 6 [Cnemaspis limi]ADY86100.1 ATPase subunit 6 [Cnemaspis limi]